MLNSMKSGAPEKDKNAAANAAEIMGRTVQPHDQAWPRSEPTTKAGTVSCIGSDMSIVGKIDCNGPAQVFGRIEGEVRASDLLISDGAHIEGSVVAQNVTVCGRVKGTIRAVRVKLQNGGAVEGDDRRAEALGLRTDFTTQVDLQPQEYPAITAVRPDRRVRGLILREQGRGPIKDISPNSTFNSCDNSSRRVARRKPLKVVCCPPSGSSRVKRRF
jgi:hypothetical protein